MSAHRIMMTRTEGAAQFAAAIEILSVRAGHTTACYASYDAGGRPKTCSPAAKTSNKRAAAVT